MRTSVNLLKSRWVMRKIYDIAGVVDFVGYTCIVRVFIFKFEFLNYRLYCEHFQCSVDICNRRKWIILEI